MLMTNLSFEFEGFVFVVGVIENVITLSITIGIPEIPKINQHNINAEK